MAFQIPINTMLEQWPTCHATINELALEANTQELWETALDWNIKALRMLCESPKIRMYLVPRIAEILIRLNRFDDADCFINEFMAFQAAIAMGWMSGINMATMWKKISRGEPGACLEDCLLWVRSNFTLSYPRTPYFKWDKVLLFNVLEMLLINKLRVRVPAAQRTGERTLKDVFFQTDMGSELEEVYPILKEMVLIDLDDHENMEQIRSLLAIMSTLRIENSAYDRTRKIKLFTVGFDDISDILDVLEAEQWTDTFKERCSNERDILWPRKEPKSKKKKGILKFF